MIGFVNQICHAFSIGELLSSPLPGIGKGDIFGNGNFLHKCKFLLQKGNVCPDFRSFSGCSGSQPLAQNNPYAKEAYFGVVHSGTI